LASYCRSQLAAERGGALRLAMNGDAEALDRLFTLYIPRLQRTAARLLRNTEDAEDALQDGLLAAFRHLDQFQGRSQFTTWIHAIVINAARSKLRRQRARPLFFSIDQPTTDEGLVPKEALTDPHSGPDDTYSDLERSQILKTIVSELPEKLRCIVVLCDIEGLRLKEAAARLGLSIPAVKSRHLRANRLVFKMAKEIGIGVERDTSLKVKI
jgi:RNA polymerase sigma-70 factor, ECF subfamily